MPHQSFICVNFGRCHAAESPREFASATPGTCPVCGQPLVNTTFSGLGVQVWLAIGAMILISISIITFAMIWRHEHSPSPASARPGGFTSGQIVNQSASSRGPALTARYFTAPVNELMQAAAKGDKAAINRLLSAQPDLIRARGRGGINLAHLALLQNDLPAFAALVSVGVDPNAPAANGISPFMAAAMLPDDRFLRAALNGALLAQKDVHGRTALHLAVMNRQKENVRLLLEAGSDPNLADSRGGTPWLAAFQGRRPMPEIVSLLRQHGADNSRADQSGLKAQDYAQAFGDPLIMSLIR